MQSDDKPCDKKTKHHNPNGGLLQLTVHIDATYRRSNSAFRLAKLPECPQRILTKLADGINNDGYDNANHEYICRVGDCILGPNNARYIIRERLGDGTFGQVVKCTAPETGEANDQEAKCVAVKIIKNKPAYFHQALVEVNILRHLSETFDRDAIVKILDFFVFRKHLCIVFELLSVNLYDVLKQNNFRGLQLGVIRGLVQQLLECVEILQKAGVAHCDLKPENILLSGARQAKIKLIDLGSACVDSSRTVHTYIQSRFYRSPDVLVGMNYTLAIDMWSVGCVCAELFLGMPCFPGSTAHDQVAHIVSMCGMLPTYMIEEGRFGLEYFTKIDDGDAPCPVHVSQWRNPDANVQKMDKQLPDVRRGHYTRSRRAHALRRSRSAPELGQVRSSGRYKHAPKLHAMDRSRSGKRTSTDSGHEKSALNHKSARKNGERSQEKIARNHPDKSARKSMRKSSEVPQDKKNTSKGKDSGDHAMVSNASTSTAAKERCTCDRKRYKLREQERTEKLAAAETQRGRTMFTSYEHMMSYVPIRMKSDKHFQAEESRRNVFKAFLKGILEVDPKNRWTATQASRHPFVMDEACEDLDKWDPGPKGYEPKTSVHPRNLTIDWCRNISLPGDNCAETYRPNIDLPTEDEPDFYGFFGNGQNCIARAHSGGHLLENQLSANMWSQRYFHHHHSPGVQAPMRPREGYDNTGNAYQKSRSPACRPGYMAPHPSTHFGAPFTPKKQTPPINHTMIPTPMKHQRSSTPNNSGNLGNAAGYWASNRHAQTPTGVHSGYTHKQLQQYADRQQIQQHQQIQHHQHQHLHHQQQMYHISAQNHQQSTASVSNDNIGGDDMYPPPQCYSNDIGYTDNMHSPQISPYMAPSDPAPVLVAPLDLGESWSPQTPASCGNTPKRTGRKNSPKVQGMQRPWSNAHASQNLQNAWQQNPNSEWHAHAMQVPQSCSVPQDYIPCTDSYEGNANGYQRRSKSGTPKNYIGHHGHGSNTPTAYWATNNHYTSAGNYQGQMPVHCSPAHEPRYYSHATPANCACTNCDATSVGGQTASDYNAQMYAHDGNPPVSPFASPYFCSSEGPTVDSMEPLPASCAMDLPYIGRKTQCSRNNSPLLASLCGTEGADNMWMVQLDSGAENVWTQPQHHPGHTPSSSSRNNNQRLAAQLRQSPHRGQDSPWRLASPATPFGFEKRQRQNSPYSSPFSSCSSDINIQDAFADQEDADHGAGRAPSSNSTALPNRRKSSSHDGLHDPMAHDNVLHGKGNLNMSASTAHRGFYRTPESKRTEHTRINSVLDSCARGLLTGHVVPSQKNNFRSAIFGVDRGPVHAVLPRRNTCRRSNTEFHQ